LGHASTFSNGAWFICGINMRTGTASSPAVGNPPTPADMSLALLCIGSVIFSKESSCSPAGTQTFPGTLNFFDGSIQSPYFETSKLAFPYHLEFVMVPNSDFLLSHIYSAVVLC
jgi:hypothetical protein